MLKTVQLKVLLSVMESLEKHPLPVRFLLRPLSRAPFLSKRLMVLPRAYMGSTAFEIHDVDPERGRWEVSTALSGGRWAPRLLVPLISNSTIVDDIRTDPLLASFFIKTMNMVSRLITDEGGWGRLEFEGVRHDPMRVALVNSQEADWLGPSEAPVCHLYTGIVAGYTSAISGKELRAREVECMAMGAPKCVFEIER